MKLARKHAIAMSLLLLAIIAPLAFAFTTLSLSQVDFTSNDAALNGKAWLLTVVENGNDQYATATYTPNDIKATVNGQTATSKQNLKLEITNSQNTCQYTFQNSYVPIQSVEMRDFNPFTGFNDCRAAGGYYYAYQTQFGVPTTLHCFINTTTGMVTPLSTPTNIIKSNLKLTSGTETVQADISNNGATSARLGNRATAAWNGNLVSGSQCPNPLDSQVMGVQKQAAFYIVNKDGYDGPNGYTTSDSAFQNCIASARTATLQASASYQYCADIVNGRVNNLLTKTTRAPFSTAALTTDGSGNGQANIALAQLVQFPVITFHISADWVGINIPVGKPNITSVTTTPFTEGTNGNIRAVVKNVGDGTGSFGISATCGVPFAFVGTTQTLKLNAGDSGFVDLPITLSASGSQQTAVCTVLAQDINQPSNKATQTVTVTGNPIAICKPGDVRCIDNKIQGCNQQGTSWVDQQVCLNGCTTQNGLPVCQNAEICTTDAQCDDHDPTTVDACVGVVSRQCQHKVIPPNPGFDFGKYGGLILWSLMAIVFGIGATILGKKVNPGFYFLHILTVIGVIGALIGLFALFSTFSAIMLAIGLVLLLLGVGLAAAELVPYAVMSFVAGLIFIIIALVSTFVTLPGWLSWL